MTHTFYEFHALICASNWSKASRHQWFLQTISSFAYSVTLEYGLPIDAAQDIGQEAWWAINRESPNILRSYDSSRSLPECRRWWLQRIRWRVRDAARKVALLARRQPNLSGDLDIAHCAHHESALEIEEFLSQLDPTARDLAEKLMHGLTIKEIAASWGCSLSRVYEARAKLKQLILAGSSFAELIDAKGATTGSKRSGPPSSDAKPR